jgi:predicted acylesterase/phospholipase RssA
MTQETELSTDQTQSKKADGPTKRSRVHECDLVMKGGITSGIVYPPLVLKLKDKYRFRSVGGTSAGAISAAATAAAEFGRESGGFEKLDRLNKQLSEENFLRNLFQPSRETRPWMETALAIIGLQNGESKSDKARTKPSVFERVTSLLPILDEKLNRPGSAYSKGLQVGFIAAFAVALFISLIVLFVLLLRSSLTGEASFWWLSFVPLLALIGPLATFGPKVGAVAYSLIDLYGVLTKKVPENGFGFCQGHRDKSTPPGVEVLTDWLHDRVDDLAGIRDRSLDRHKEGYRPLTFGDLKNKKFGDKRDVAKQNELNRSRKEENISLRMVTSNLNQNQPFVLPFKDDHLLLFSRKDFERLFPDDVVDYLVRLSDEYRKEAQATASTRTGKQRSKYDLYIPPPGFHFFPEADDLPVIIATRMSLSFPILLSAVPLYTVKHGGWKSDDAWQLEEDNLQVNWFSDGGICSNFPIHFFDSWLPTRPTFGVNLTALPDQGLKAPAAARHDPARQEVQPEFISVAACQDQTVADPVTDAIYLPKADAALATEYIPLTVDESKRPDLFKFLWAIFSTAQNYRDNAQSMLPSYRERIVQIRLSEDEGGLNLAMPSGTIDNVMKKGERAGELLSNFDFEVHQWVRFRVLMKQMEVSLNKLNDVMNKNPFYLSTLRNRPLKTEFPYQRDEVWLEEAEQRLILMGELISGFKKLNPPALFEEDAPLPEPVLRVTPEI